MIYFINKILQEGCLFMSEYKMSQINVSKIKKAVEAEIPILITTYTLPHDMELYIREVITFYLKELHQEHMIEYIVYCVNELVTNAKKANTKRVYFQEKGLDLFNEEEYNEGMKKFKEDTLGNITHYLKLQKDAGLYIKLILHKKGNTIRIEIRNNSPLTVFEYKRMHDKIARSHEFGSVEEAFVHFIDETEGAGLGLIILTLMLKKVGLSEENFQIASEGEETITRIDLPLNKESEAQLDAASEEIAKSIDALPFFPENIASIHALMSDPEVEFSEIARLIGNDISLTADLLKLVNSSVFALSQPCNSIVRAVQMVGIKGIKNLLYSVESLKILGEETPGKKMLWSHSQKVAFYSYNIARNFFATKKEIVENAYVCGLLHDMGKVVFETTHPEVMKKFKDIMAYKNIALNTLERLIAGINHAEVGARIGEKWNFPEMITQAIRYHHNPLVAPEPVMPLVLVVYLANMLTHYEESAVDFYQFDTEALKKCNISSKEQLDSIASQLSAAFAKAQK
jgi:putative nucleotidyltransferase with HDIG domain